jgi:hypothetical protein
MESGLPAVKDEEQTSSRRHRQGIGGGQVHHRLTLPGLGDVLLKSTGILHDTRSAYRLGGPQSKPEPLLWICASA